MAHIAMAQKDDPVKRIDSVDVFRLLAIIAVIAIHTSPFGAPQAQTTPTLQFFCLLINQMARFAVPFFFVTSGFFWGQRVRQSQEVWAVSISMLKRVGLIWGVWSLVYLLPYDLGLAYESGWWEMVANSWVRLGRALNHPVVTLLDGAHPHLWFLSALACALLLTSCCVAQQAPWSLAMLSAGLFISAVLAKTYADTPWGFDWGINTRNGPFFGTALFASGYALSRWTPSTRWFLIGALIFVSGVALHATELWILWQVYRGNPYQDFYFGTYGMGLGAAMMALSNHRCLSWPQLSHMGRLSLGIYALHFIVVDWLKPVAQRIHAPWWELTYVLIVLGLSWAMASGLARYKSLRAVLS